MLNGEVVAVAALDIFGRVGRGVAHDEYIPFTIAGHRLTAGGQETQLRGNKVKVEFVKVRRYWLIRKVRCSQDPNLCTIPKC